MRCFTAAAPTESPPLELDTDDDEDDERALELTAAEEEATLDADEDATALLDDDEAADDEDADVPFDDDAVAMPEDVEVPMALANDDADDDAAALLLTSPVVVACVHARRPMQRLNALKQCRTPQAFRERSSSSMRVDAWRHGIAMSAAFDAAAWVNRTNGARAKLSCIRHCRLH